jgi:hypothetical protein
MINPSEDSGIATIPAARPSTFTPVSYVQAGGLLGRPLDAVDTGSATNPASIANTFDNLNIVPVTVDPGSA